MSVKRVFNFGGAAILGIAIILAGAAFTQDIDRSSKDEVLRSVEQTLEQFAFVPGADFSKVDGYLASEKPKIDQASTDEAFRNAVSEALEKLGYSHIVLFTPAMVDQRRNNAAIGIGIMAMYKDHSLLVHTVFNDTPAQEAGLEPGDVITEVDGKKPEFVGAMAGDEGAKVQIKFTKFEGGEKEATLTRRKFSTVVPPTLTWADKDTAVLRIPTFDLSYDRERVNKLAEQASKSKNLVLDLRNNGGGTVTSMCHLLGFFMPSNEPVGTFVSKKVVQQFVDQTHGDPTDLRSIARWAPHKITPQRNDIAPYAGHLAVLVNANSGSASEIAAEALKESLGTPIVGEKSAGKVLVSVLAQLPHGYQLQYPITDFVSPKGIRLEGTGITPDLTAKDPRVMKAGVADEPVDKAAALLHREQIRQERFGN